MRSKLVTESLRQAGAMVCDRIKEMFLTGQCDYLSPEDLSNLVEYADPDKFLTGRQAIKYMHVGMKRFYDLKALGFVPVPQKVKGFIHAVYRREDIDEAIRKTKLMTDAELRMAIINKRAQQKQEKRKEVLKRAKIEEG